jgi:hypothetical protein
VALPPGQPARDAVEQLRELSELRRNGTISEEEFQSLKANIMKSLAWTGLGSLVISFLR